MLELPEHKPSVVVELPMLPVTVGPYLKNAIYVDGKIGIGELVGGTGFGVGEEVGDCVGFVGEDVGTVGDDVVGLLVGAAPMHPHT